MKKVINTLRGFTIIELLVVITIIGILTAISFVSYNGVQNRAVITSLQSDLQNASDQLVILQAKNNTGVFLDMAGLQAAESSGTIHWNSGTTRTYVVNNSNTPKTFCLTATRNNQSYFITQEGLSLPGPCPVLYLDAGIATSYPGSGTTWTSLSGNGNNASLAAGVAYSTSNGGALVFDGSTTDYGVLPIGVPSGRAFTIEVIGKIGNTAVANNFISANPPAFIRVLNNKVRWNIHILKDSDSTYSWSFNNGNINIAQDTVYDLVMTYDGANLRGYVNGSIDVTIPFAGQTVASQNIRIGYTTGGEDSPLIGEVYVVKVYNQVLSPSVITQNFSAIRNRYGI